MISLERLGGSEGLELDNTDTCLGDVLNALSQRAAKRACRSGRSISNDILSDIALDSPHRIRSLSGAK
jgi:hypothetical protein